MKKQSYIFFVVIFVSFIIADFLVVKKVNAPAVNLQLTIDNLQQETDNLQLVTSNDQNKTNKNQEPLAVDPLEGALFRITKKPFGIFITPETSPVQPERFQGYHTGTDLETTPDEQRIDVSVRALCDGKLLTVRFANGYGGVAVQSCMLSKQKVTVIYGHINLKSLTAKVGEQLMAGDFLANLGDGFSAQTDGERKHLHLGIHRGQSIDISGYVQNKNQLGNWIDAAKYLY